MKTYIETIFVSLNDDPEPYPFKSLDMAIAEYELIKKRGFGNNATETISENGERFITDGEDKLSLWFLTKSCTDREFENLQPASIATL